MGGPASHPDASPALQARAGTYVDLIVNASRSLTGVQTVVFIGVLPELLTGDDIANVADQAIVLALANPDPEVDPFAAGERGAIVATGRSDYPNQISNVLALPGVLPRKCSTPARTRSSTMPASRRARDRRLSAPRPVEREPRRAVRVPVATAVAAAVRKATNWPTNSQDQQQPVRQPTRQRHEEGRRVVTISEPTILDPASVGDERIRQVLAAPITSDETLDTLAGVFHTDPLRQLPGSDRPGRDDRNPQATIEFPACPRGCSRPEWPAQPS